MKKFTIRYEEDKTTFTKVKVNNEALIMIDAEGDIKIGDEYHTIDELYDHRMTLTIALFHTWNSLGPGSGFRVIKSKLHNDGTMFDGGYFIVMAITPMGQISYHYKLKHWDKFKIDELDKAFPYDGHTSRDVLERLEMI